ncbi:unnamed protein product [Scytosiphon promiscuus]
MENATIVGGGGPDGFPAGTILADRTGCDNTNMPGSPGTDREVLVHLYRATGGESWTEQAGWAEKAADVGTWWGVTTNTAGRVEQLELKVCDLEGAFLFLPNNLSGTIPKELGKLAALQLLDLSFNKLSGAIPKELGMLAALQVLEFVETSLTGAIPKELGELTALQYLDMHGSSLSGGIPKEFGKLTNLVRLDLSENNLDGPIPEELGCLTALLVLRLASNKLKGCIPKELGNLENLLELNLCWNQLDGVIPHAIGNLTCLKELDLSCNQLHGSIPEELGSLTKLAKLNLSSNRLSGFVPWELGKLESLTLCSLRDNELCGLWDEGRTSDHQDSSSRHGHCRGAPPPELIALCNIWAKNTRGDIRHALEGNPWQYPPAAVITAGASAVTEFFTSAFAEGSSIVERPLKVVLIGKETVGKTSLRQSMREMKGCPTVDVIAASTVHIDVEDLNVLGKRVRIFDCAGQEAYYASLQLFLTTYALYVLVVDMASAVEHVVEDDQDPLAELGVLRWLRSLAYRVPKAAVVLVGTKCDLVKSTASQSSLSRLEEAATTVEAKIRDRIRSWSQSASSAPRRHTAGKPWPEMCLEPGMRLVSLGEPSPLPQLDGDAGWSCDVNEPGLLGRILKDPSGVQRAVSMRLPFSWQRALEFLDNHAERCRGRADFRGIALAELREEWRKQPDASEAALDGALLLRGSEGGLVVYGSLVFFDVDWLAQVLKPLLSHKSIYSAGRTRLGGIALPTSPMLDRFEERGILEPALAKNLWTEETAPHVLKTLESAGLTFPLAGDDEGGLVVLLRLPKDRPVPVGIKLDESRSRLERDGERHGQIKAMCTFWGGVPPGFIERLLTKCCRLGSCDLFWRFGVFIESDHFSAIFGYEESQDLVGKLSLDVYGDCTTAHPWGGMSACLSIVIGLLTEFPGMDVKTRLECQQHPSLSQFPGMDAMAKLEHHKHSSPGGGGISVGLSQRRYWEPLIRGTDGCPSCRKPDRQLARLLLLYLPVAESSFGLERFHSIFDRSTRNDSGLLSQWAVANTAARKAAKMAKRLEREAAERKRIADEDAETKRIEYEEAERKRLQEVAERKRVEDELERKRAEEEAAKKRLEDQIERERLEDEEERKRSEERQEAEDANWSDAQKGFGALGGAFFAAFVAFAAVDDPKPVLWGIFLALAGVSALIVLGIFESRRRVHARRAITVVPPAIP